MGWPPLLLALWLRSQLACMVARRRRRYTTAAAAAAPPPCTLASLTFNLSPAMARLRHRCAAKCRERYESRGEDLKGVRIIPFFAFVTIAALAAPAAAAAASTICATRAIVFHLARHCR